MGTEQFNQTSLEAAIKDGRTDFTGITVTEEVTLSIPPSVERLIFDRANLGPSFTICGWNNPNADLSMIGVTVIEAYVTGVTVRSVGITVRGNYGWLQLRECQADSISLTGSTFQNGLKILESSAAVLDLTDITSNRSFITKKNLFESVIDTNARLGDVQGETLGEYIARQHTTTT